MIGLLLTTALVVGPSLPGFVTEQRQESLVQVRCVDHSRGLSPIHCARATHHDDGAINGNWYSDPESNAWCGGGPESVEEWHGTVRSWLEGNGMFGSCSSPPHGDPSPGPDLVDCVCMDGRLRQVCGNAPDVTLARFRCDAECRTHGQLIAAVRASLDHPDCDGVGQAEPAGEHHVVECHYGGDDFELVCMTDCTDAFAEDFCSRARGGVKPHHAHCNWGACTIIGAPTTTTTTLPALECLAYADDTVTDVLRHLQCVLGVR
jgi:hypothetical protein